MFTAYNSLHCEEDRKPRFEFINQYLGVGKVLDSFLVDRGHPNGKEIHKVTDNAVILIYNAFTGKLITELVARPEQIRRLYRSVGKKPPRSVISLAYKHNAMRYNEI